MVASRVVLPFTEKEYLALEGVAETRHEFVGGEIIAMAGAELNHNKIAMNVGFALKSVYAERRCTVIGSDQRVRVDATKEYFYPDVTVVCGTPKVVEPAPSSLTNPEMIFEVLSPSTERYDRVDKWFAYQTIATLTDYVLIASDRRHIEQFKRRTGEAWAGPHVVAPEERLVLSDGTALDVAALYDLVEL